MAAKATGGLLRQIDPKVLAGHIKLLAKILTKGQTGCFPKIVIFFGLLWILSPWDFSIGPIDDILVLWAMLYLLPELMPAKLIDPLKEEAGVD